VPRRLAVVPARNEEDAVGRVVAELRSFDAELDVVVVDDGSEDATAERAAAAGPSRPASSTRSSAATTP
jgi:glycosyltransferase involved in cell wall biosynthesis